MLTTLPREPAGPELTEKLSVGAHGPLLRLWASEALGRLLRQIPGSPPGFFPQSSGQGAQRAVQARAPLSLEVNVLGGETDSGCEGDAVGVQTSLGRVHKEW